MCLDTGTLPLMLYPCHGYGGNQLFAFAESGQIVAVDQRCVGINHQKDVILVSCFDTDESQLWTYVFEEEVSEYSS